MKKVLPDIVNRLRAASGAAAMKNAKVWSELMEEAATEIEKLRRDVARNTLHADWSKG